MNSKVSGYWDIKKVRLKQKYKNLSDKDLCFSEGKEKEMIELLGNKLGKTKQELLNIILSI